MQRARIIRYVRITVTALSLTAFVLLRNKFAMYGEIRSNGLNWASLRYPFQSPGGAHD